MNERREKLKQDYKTIEAKEKRRLKSKQMKTERDLHELKSFSLDFQEFFTDFDSEMDYLANKASLDGQVLELQSIQKELKRDTQFFKSSEFKMPTFSFINNELELIDGIGKITNNSDFSMPLVTFNTHTL